MAANDALGEAAGLRRVIIADTPFFDADTILASARHDSHIQMQVLDGRYRFAIAGGRAMIYPPIAAID